MVVNEALTKFVDALYERFFESWYKVISDDADFPTEFKINVQHIFARLNKSFEEGQAIEILFSELPRLFLTHASHLLTLQNSNNTSYAPEEILVKLGPHLHSAVYSRQAEIDYLRSITYKLLPKLLKAPGVNSAKYLSKSLNSASSDSFCNYRRKDFSSNPLFLDALAALLDEIVVVAILLPMMDNISQSDFLNRMVILSLDSTPTNVTSVDNSQAMILSSYVSMWSQWLAQKRSTTIDRVMKRQDSFYSFQQFAKNNGLIQLLSFFTLYTDVNDRLADLVPSEERCLQFKQSVQELLDLTISDGDTDFLSSQHEIRLPRNFIHSVRACVQDPDPSSILQLKHTAPWLSAYHVIAQIIEERYLSMYYESPEYLAVRSYRSAQSSSMSKSSSEQNARPKSSIFTFSPLKLMSCSANLEVPDPQPEEQTGKSIAGIFRRLSPSPTDKSLSTSPSQ
ncbi:Sorting nexin-14 [Cichlidogyrus casuarinus]|uniref:Sorting nexin-14 n=1 Tax=Cichlidogyrus casuarinus TaxID=1844966 RepID=A0ABD2Q2P5_9PLAT